MHHVPEFRVLRVCLRGSRAHDFPVRSPSRELSRSYKSGSPRFQRWNRVIHPVCFVEIITADVCWRIFETVVLFVILRWRREMLFECLAFSRLIENGMELLLGTWMNFQVFRDRGFKRFRIERRFLEDWFVDNLLVEGSGFLSNLVFDNEDCFKI